MLLAVPSDAPGGLEAKISEHFGHCSAFTLIQIDDNKMGKVTILPNAEHVQGGCMGPVMVLKDNGADALVAGGMGGRPLAGFQQVGITVYHNEGVSTVREAAELIISGKGREIGEQHTCGGHEGGCGSHDHHDQEPKVEHVDGPVEPERLVHISYELFDIDDKSIDTSEARYIHGRGQLALGLERALTGHVAGDNFEVTVEPEEGYGERDEAKLIEVPRDKLPAEVSLGETLHSKLPNGGMIPITVVSLDDKTATLDANHPLAGQRVLFKVKVLEVLRILPTEEQKA